MAVVWTLAAARGIQRAYDYIVDFNPRAAMRVAKSLRTEGNSLAKFPQRGRPVTGNNMRDLVASYDHIIRYRIEGEDVVILRIRHTARRPTIP